MTQVVSIDAKITKDLLSLLRELKQQIVRLNERLDAAPPYGSNEWWEWSEKKADEDVKMGRVSAVLRNKNELQEFLDSLKTP